MTRTALILGAAVRPDGSASPGLRRRVEHAADLFHCGEVARVIPCGGVGRHGPSEAEVMAAILRDRGVPAQALVLEGRSTDTISNIGNALRLCPDLREVVIVTDAYHAPRARLIARHLGLTASSSSPADGPSGLRLQRARLREAASMIKVVIWMATGHRLRRGNL